MTATKYSCSCGVPATWFARLDDPTSHGSNPAFAACDTHVAFHLHLILDQTGRPAIIRRENEGLETLRAPS